MTLSKSYASSHHIASTLAVEELWALLRQGFEDSERSELWPRELEQVSSPSLGEGEQIRARYKVLGPVGATQTYLVSSFEPPRSLAYQTGRGHPLQGGGSVEVRSRPGGGSELLWSFEYRVPPRARSWLGYLYVRHLFEPKFFAALEANLRAVEAKRPRQASSARARGQSRHGAARLAS